MKRRNRHENEGEEAEAEAVTAVEDEDEEEEEEEEEEEFDLKNKEDTKDNPNSKRTSKKQKVTNLEEEKQNEAKIKPAPRTWMKHKELASRKARKPSWFTISTMNLLAEGLDNPKLFTSVKDKTVLNWSTYRKSLTLETILFGEPDIILLQEVNHFDEIQRTLDSHGFSGKFAQKQQSPCVKLGFPSDGCAMFVRNTKFKVLKLENVKFPKMSQVFQIAHLSFVGRQNDSSLIEPIPDLLVVGTHLKAKQPHETTRRAQLDVIAKRINQEVANYPAGIGVVFGGDLNSHFDGPAQVHFHQSTGLSNAFADLVVDEKNFFTTFKIKNNVVMKHSIDHIYYNQEHLKLVDRLGLPDCPSEGLPCSDWPSDHISMLACFDYQKKE